MRVPAKKRMKCERNFSCWLSVPIFFWGVKGNQSFVLTSKQQQREEEQQEQQEALAFAVGDDVLRAGVKDPGVEAEHRRDQQVKLAEAQQHKLLDGLEDARENS